MPEKSAPYWTKNAEKLGYAKDLLWNFPEQRSGSLLILGGHSGAFSTEVKLADYISHTFPMVKNVHNLFPDSLKSKLPPLVNLSFFNSTDSGSFANSSRFASALQNPPEAASTPPLFALLSGDFSKNSETAIAVSSLIKSSQNIPLLLARDSLDLVLTEGETLLNHSPLILVASLAQLQKLFRAVFYPKMLLLSSPLFPVVETLHKFTLSYPVALLTFHDGMILCAHNGQVCSEAIEKTSYSPLSLWAGELAAKIAVFSMFNPSKPLESLVAGVNYDKISS